MDGAAVQLPEEEAGKVKAALLLSCAEMRPSPVSLSLRIFFARLVLQEDPPSLREVIDPAQLGTLESSFPVTVVKKLLFHNDNDGRPF